VLKVHTSTSKSSKAEFGFNTINPQTVRHHFSLM
jgi:hypothetical protein